MNWVWKPEAEVMRLKNLRASRQEKTDQKGRKIKLLKQKLLKTAPRHRESGLQ